MLLTKSLKFKLLTIGLLLLCTQKLFAASSTRPICNTANEGAQTVYTNPGNGQTTASFCNGSAWTDLIGTYSGSNCTASEDTKIQYNLGVLRYCSANKWYQLSGNIISTCAPSQQALLTYDKALKLHKFCNGTNWFGLNSAIPNCVVTNSTCSAVTGFVTYSYLTTSGCTQHPPTTCAVNCNGYWSVCQASQQKYTWSVTPKNGGAACPYANGQVRACTMPGTWQIFKYYIGGDIRSCPYAQSSNGIPNSSVSGSFSGLGGTCTIGNYYFSPTTIVQGGNASSMFCDGHWQSVVKCPACRVYICK